MRILHISTRLILGGSQENTILSCEGQARLGHTVLLAFGPIYGPEGSLLERARRFRTGDGRIIETREIPHLVREVKPHADVRCLAELERLILDWRPDIVHTHSSKAGIIGRFAAFRVRRATKRRLGIVHTIHGPPFMPEEGSLPRRAKIRAVNHAYVLAERAAARRCDVIVSVADAMTEQFLARGIGRREQYATVYSGMEVSEFVTPRSGEDRDSVRARLGFAPNDFVIGTVARLAEHKGHDDIIDALADELRARADWRLLWVGDGWWRGRLLARLDALGLRKQVTTTGLVGQDRVPGLMRAMDVLVHPSYREGLPRTVPQALLAGAAPIAYDTDGTREACIRDVTGKLIPLGDRAALRSAVLELHDHSDRRSAMVARGRDDCARRFDEATMVADLERIYARALHME